MVWLITAAGTALAVPLAVAMFHPLSAALTKAIGRERCLDPGGLNGCDWWPYAVLFSGVAVFAASSRLGWAALVLAPAGPVLATLLAGVGLWFGGRNTRRREWVVDGDRILDRRGGGPVPPAWAEQDGCYEMTGPGTGYSVYTLCVVAATGKRLSNVYVAKADRDRDLTELRRLGVPWFDLVLSERRPDEFRIVFFGAEWARLLCGDPARLPAGDRTWWAGLVQPTFGPRGRMSVEPHEMLSRLSTLTRAYADEFEAADRCRRDCEAAATLLRSATGSVTLCTYDAHAEELEAARSGSSVLMRSEDGVMIERVGNG